MTERTLAGHSETVQALLQEPRLPVAGDEPAVAPVAAQAPASVHAIYDAYFDFVWRSVRRLGVAAASADDAVQDVFLVVHRRLGEFEGRSSLKTWLFGIALRVARDHRRRVRRKGTDSELPDGVADPSGSTPLDLALKAEAVELLDRLLDDLDEGRRAVLVLADLEQMTAPEIAETLGVNLNTVYSRLRAARRDFDQAVARHKAHEAWRKQ